MVRVSVKAIAWWHLYNAHDYFHISAGEVCSFQFGSVGLSSGRGDESERQQQRESKHVRLP
jgi:hypothetical protein